MADIFNEIEQDLRHERFKRLWNRFGIYVIGLAVVIVAGIGGWRAWEAWKESHAKSGGDQFYAALQTAAAGDHKAAAAAMQKLADEKGGGYKILGRFRAASELAAGGDGSAAIAAFDAIASDGSVPILYRNLAHVRAGYLALAGADPKGAEARVSSLAVEGGPWRQPAREIMGLAAYAGGDLEAAQRYFQAIVSDPDGPSDAIDRARIMLAVIQGAMPAPAEHANDAS